MCNECLYQNLSKLRQKQTEVLIPFIEQFRNMFCVSIELQEHEWKFERTRNTVRTLANQQHLLLSQTFAIRFLSIEMWRSFFLFHLEKSAPYKKETTCLVNQNVNYSLCSGHHYFNCSCQLSVSVKLYIKHDFKPIRLHIFFGLFTN